MVKCYDCGKSFFNERFFEAHVKRRHSNENIIKNQEVTVSLLSRSAHTNNQYESRIFTMIFLFIYLQVNLCQKLFFLHQLTHNTRTDCSLNYKFNTWKFQAQNMGRTCCVQKLFLTFRTIYVHNMFSPCSTNIRAPDKDLHVCTSFLTFRSFEFRNFWFTMVYNSILFSSPLVLLSNLNLPGFCFRVFLCVPTLTT